MGTRHASFCGSPGVAMSTTSARPPISRFIQPARSGVRTWSGEMHSAVRQLATTWRFQAASLARVSGHTAATIITNVRNTRPMTRSELAQRAVKSCSAKSKSMDVLDDDMTPAFQERMKQLTRTLFCGDTDVVNDQLPSFSDIGRLRRTKSPRFGTSVRLAT